MKTAIIGAGSAGIAIGAYAAREKHDVMLVVSSPVSVNALRKNGATVLHSRSGADFTVPVSACLSEELTGEYDVILLTTKQTTNQTVFPVAERVLSKNGVICTLQNGVPEPSVAQALGADRTTGGSILFAAGMTEPGVTRITTDYDNLQKHYAFLIGEMDKPCTERLEDVASVLRPLGEVELTDELMSAKWSKLLVNCSRSGMSAALSLKSGDIIDNPKSLACALFLAKECIEVSKACGYSLVRSVEDPADYYWEDKAQLRKCMEIFKRVGEPVRNNRASMLQDLEKKRPTEIDYINGFVVSMGLRHGIQTPFNARVVELVKEAESRGRPNDPGVLSRFDDLLRGYEDIYN